MGGGWLHVFGKKTLGFLAPGKRKEQKRRGHFEAKALHTTCMARSPQTINMGRGVQLASCQGKDTKTSHHHLGTMSLFPNGTVLMRLQVLKSYTLKAVMQMMQMIQWSLSINPPHLPQIHQVGGYSNDTIQLIMLPNISLQQSIQILTHTYLSLHIYIYTYIYSNI